MALVLAGAAQADTAYVTCQPGNAMAVIDLAGAGQPAEWAMPGAPAGVAIGAPGELYTVAPNAKRVRRIARATGKVLAEVTLDGGPMGVAYDGARGRLFVSDWYNARIWVLDARDLGVSAELATGAAPAGIAVSPDAGFVSAAAKDADKVSLFDAETLALIGEIPVGVRPYGLRFAPDGRLFVGNVGSNDVTVIDPQSRAVLATVPVGERPYGIAFARGKAFVTNQYAGTVSVISLDTLTPLATLTAGEYPEGIDTALDGRHVAFVNWFDNTLMVIDADTLDLTATHDTCDGPRAFGTFLAKGAAR